MSIPRIEIIHRSDFCPVYVDNNFVGIIMYIKGIFRKSWYKFYSNDVLSYTIVNKDYDFVVDKILDYYWR